MENESLFVVVLFMLTIFLVRVFSKKIVMYWHRILKIDTSLRNKGSSLKRELELAKRGKSRYLKRVER